MKEQFLPQPSIANGFAPALGVMRAAITSPDVEFSRKVAMPPSSLD